MTVRNVFVIGPDKKVKLFIAYPMTTGRNFDEVLRVLDSMQLTAKHKVATPANWKQGDDVIIAGRCRTRTRRRRIRTAGRRRSRTCGSFRSQKAEAGHNLQVTGHRSKVGTELSNLPLTSDLFTFDLP